MSRAPNTVLKLSSELELPMDAITERLGWLGTSGSGKTYGAGKLAEEMLHAGAQVLVIDPVGPWWGLRSSADGKRAGFPITVFGGIHADLPLTPESGALVADILVDRGISAVLDVSDMTVGEMHRFVSAFAERFFDRKKRNPTPVHVFLEEAHTFLPQQLPPEPAAAIMLHRMERIVRVGRNYGIGTSQISQLPQAVTKKTLNTVACLFAFGTIGSQERKALAAWFDQNGGGDLAKELPGLPTGHAFAVSPRWLRVTQKLVIAAKTTFDSSETPKFGGPPPTPKVLAAVDVEQLRVAMAETIAAATADDPKALRKRIAELEKELKAKPAAPAPKTVEVEKPVISDAQLRRIEVVSRQITDGMNSGVAKLFTALKPVADAVAVVRVAVSNPRTLSTVASPPAAKGGVQAVIAAAPPFKILSVRSDAVARPAADGDTKLGKCEMGILGALAVRRPTALSRDQIAIGSGYSATSGAFGVSLAKVKTLGLVETTGGLFSLTEAGEAAAPSVDVPSSPADVLAMWLRHPSIGKCERVVLELLVQQYPNALSRDQIASSTGYSPTSGAFGVSLAKLRTLALIEYVAGGMRASADIGGAR